MGIYSQSALVKLIFAIYKILPSAKIAYRRARDHLFSVEIEGVDELTEDILALIETEMGSSDELQFMDMIGSNAAELFDHNEQPLLADSLREAGDEIVVIARKGSSYVPAYSELDFDGAYKLVSAEKMGAAFLIKGVAAEDKQKLKKILKKLEASQLIDHFRLGQEQELFFPDKSQDCVLFTKRGTLVYEQLKNFWEKFHGQQIVHSPVKDATIDPSWAHAAAFRHLAPTEKDLPVVFSELHPLAVQKKHYHGLLDTPFFTRDTTHIFTTADQAPSELTSSLLFIQKSFMMLDFEVQWHLSLESQMLAGTRSSWNQGVQLLNDALQAAKIEWEPRSMDHDTHGPAAYITISDAIGQRWEVAALAIDIALAETHNLSYQEVSSNRLHTPIVIKRSLFLSVERIMALQLENKEGLLPTWLTAEQVRLLPIAERHQEKGREFLDFLLAKGIRAEIDLTTDPLGTKVHLAEKAKVPWMVVIGDQELAHDTLALRRCGDPKPRTGVTKEAFLSELLAENSPYTGNNQETKG